MTKYLLLAIAVCLVACGQSPNGTEELSDTSSALKTRYQWNNQCVELQTAAGQAIAEAFYFKPAALGQYLLYAANRQLLSSNGTQISYTPLTDAHEDAVWNVLGEGDRTVYPNAPQVNTATDPAALQAYRDFNDPTLRFERFTLQSNASGSYLALDDDAQLGVSNSLSNATAFQLSVVDNSQCAIFPEASSNTEGETFSGKTANGQVLGFADSHLHATSTTFLGGAKPGWPFHRYGVSHALHDCAEQHGEGGERDVLGALFTNDVDGHDTRGWPEFPDWPSAVATTHEATYWKWIERAWKAGLRVITNYAVDNETLCEIQRNVAETPLRDCNEMVNADQQIATMYAMQDYIDAQYGGRGQGWWRIVTNANEARAVIEQGKLAVIIGIEVSNLLNCSVSYNPASTQEAFEETGDISTGGQSYGCAMTETGAANEILTQLQALKQKGVSGLFTIHEFDNAFGGNDIFDGFVLNLGTKENSGGISAAEQSAAGGLLTAPQALEAINHLEPNGLATGEFWSTYDCPGLGEENVGDSFIFGKIGAEMTNLGPPPPACLYAGQGGRPGGATACYPAGFQCNARLLTPMGLYLFQKIMEMGFIFEIDHLAFDVKNQLLDLAEAQATTYPTISGHGFSGLTETQALRIYQGGGLVYPCLNNTREFIDLWQRLKNIWQAAGAPGVFGFGFGSDTNGLSPQAFARDGIKPGDEVVYPYTLFSGRLFDQLPEFASVEAVRFFQPQTRDADGLGRSWHIDQDGNAHYGLASGSVQELRIEGSAAQLRDLYRSAEAYLQFWQRSESASQAIKQQGFVVPDGLMRAAPVN